MAENRLRGKVAIAGVGYAPVSRDSGRSETALTVQAALAALDDAGLSPADVDGLTAFPDRTGGETFAGPTMYGVQHALGLHNIRYWQAAGTGPAQFACALLGAHAIAAGDAEVVLCWRTVIAQPRVKVVRKRTGSIAWSEAAFSAPYGASGSAPKWAMVANRFMHETGTKPEHLGAVVVNNRAHAAINQRAVWANQPITLDEYFDVPLVSDPLRRVDCDMPIDASVAVVLTSAERARDLRHAPAIIEAISTTPGPMLEHDLMPDFTKQASWYIGQDLWTRTDLRPADVDVLQTYDGFSFQALQWLEDMGFCGRGEAGPMVADGHCRLGGRLPMCTDGGQLGVGRYHGFEKLAEAARQLWGGAGAGQVVGAEVSLACTGGGPRAGAVLLTTS